MQKGSIVERYKEYPEGVEDFIKASKAPIPAMHTLYVVEEVVSHPFIAKVKGLILEEFGNNHVYGSEVFRELQTPQTVKLEEITSQTNKHGRLSV